MLRRDFIAGLCVSAGSLSAWGQQIDRVKRIGLIDAIQEGAAPFAQELARLGWMEGRNVHVDYRFIGGDDAKLRTVAAELVDTHSDLIVATGTQSTSILKQLTSTIPIVFVNVADPVASGLVASYAHPGGNITGFTSVEFSFAGKWLNLLKDIVPNMGHAMALYSPDNSNWRGYLQTLEKAAEALHVKVQPASATTVSEIIDHIESFAREPGGGMIVLPSAVTGINRGAIAALAARNRLPAIYAYKNYVTAGGLASYGSNFSDLFRRAAEYADRVFKGETDLPVQAPTKFEFVINLKAARELGLEIPPSVLAIADEVVE